MTDAAKLEALAVRCEQLFPDWGEIHRLNNDIHAIKPDPKTALAADYCRSLDAAMTLVPEGWRVRDLCHWLDERKGERAEAWTVELDGPRRLQVVDAEALTAANALAAAALRARAQQLQSKGGEG